MCGGGEACVGYGLAAVGFKATNNKATAIKTIFLGGVDALTVMYYREWTGSSHQSAPKMRLIRLMLQGGDGSPISRGWRVLKMYWNRIASGSEDTISWNAPMEHEQQIDPTKRTIGWTFNDGVVLQLLCFFFVEFEDPLLE